VASNADAAERALNGSVEIQPHSVTKTVEQLGEPAETTAGADAAGEDQASADADDDVGGGEPAARSETAGFRLALAVGLASVLALGGVGGWLGYGWYQARQADQVRNQFLAVGKQGALNLTTINYTEADADVQRVLDSSTGQFYDDFSERAPAFIEVVKQAQSKTQGTITNAGVESISGESARVLVAVAVNTSNRSAADQPVRLWRMRIDIQRVGDTVKVSNVGFVP